METKRLSYRKIIYLFFVLVRITVSLILFIAAVSKIRNPYLFFFQIQAYEMLNDFLNMIIAIIFPWIELVVSSCLITGILLIEASMIGVGLFSIFILAISSALIRGLKIECGCFGLNAHRLISWELLLQDFILLLLCLFIAFYSINNFRRIPKVSCRLVSE